MAEAVRAIETPQQAARRLASKPIRDGYQPTALHEYQNADGGPVLWRIRCKHADGDKWIRPMHFDGTGYSLGNPEEHENGWPVYRLPKLVAEPDRPVWFVEGENCADALSGLEFVATTTGSASSAEGADLSPLAGREVTIWPDNDEAGKKYAQDVADRLCDLGCDVAVVDIDQLGLSEHGDVVDWLAANPDAGATAVYDLPVSHLDNSGGTSGTSGTPCDTRASLSHPKVGQGGTIPYFELNENGVFWIDVIRDKDGAVTGEASPAWICSPMRVAAMTRDAENGEWGRLLVFDDADGHEHRWTCPQSMHAGNGDELRAMLLREGLTITTDTKLRRKIGDFIQQATPDVRARCVERTGWHGDVFALPRQTYGDSESEPVLFQAANIDGVNLGQAGSLEEWVASVAAPCARNSRLALALSMAFAGPCLGLLKTEGGGIHLRGQSSTGKSTALQVAASVFGPPDAFTRTWRTTDNGLEGTASMHSDLLLVLDEIGQLDPKHAGASAYMLANGQGKSRSYRDGSPRPIPTWRLMFLSAGEIGLADLVTQSGQKIRAGQEVRVIDLPADAGKGMGIFDHADDPGALADHLKIEAGKHHGHALRRFLELLVDDPESTREKLRTLRSRISEKMTPDGAAGQVRRVVDRFALIGAAGEVATRYGLTGWSDGDAIRAAIACFNAWLDSRGTCGDSENQAMLSQVRGFLEANGEARFTLWDAPAESTKTINRAGFRRLSDTGPTYYVERECFRKEVCKGFDYRAVINVLDAAGALLTESGKSTCKSRLPDGRHTRVYVITPNLWEES